MNEPWWESHTNLARLARWLIAEQDYSCRDLVGFLEKPWKWSSEWDTMTKADPQDTTPYVSIEDQIERAEREYVRRRGL